MKRNPLCREEERKKQGAVRMFATLLALFATLSAHQATAQTQQRVSLEMRHATIEQVITRMKETTRYRFFYRVDDLPATPARDYSFNNATIESVMNDLMSGTDLRWSLTNGMIQIARRAAQPSDSSGEVRGSVTDDKGYPLVGATVIIAGTNRGASTDANGRFVIDRVVEFPVTLRISYMGMVTRQVEANGGSDIAVRLETDVTAIDGVIVTGYQTLSRERATGAFTTISADQLRDKPQTNLMDRLEGMLPGLMVNKSGVSIRGVTTLRGTADPLFVVDGFIWDGEDMNPLIADNIQSVTVLKDAAAASIYGARSANGVIVITTKSGQAGKLNVSGRAQFSVTPIPGRSGRDILSNSEMIDIQKELYEEYRTQLKRRVSTAWPDVFDLTYRRDIGMISDTELDTMLESMRTADNGSQFRDLLLRPRAERLYSMTVSGGSERNTFSIGGEYVADRNSSYERNVGSDRVSINIKDNLHLNKWLSATAGVIASYGDRYGNLANALSLYASEPSWRMLTDADGGTVAWNRGKPQEEKDRLAAIGLRSEKYNPLDEKNSGGNYTNSLGLRINGSVNARITRGVDFTLMYEKSNMSAKSKNIVGADSYKVSNMVNDAAQIGADGEPVYNIPPGAQLREIRTTESGYTLRGQFSFDRTFGTAHAVSAILGGERHKTVSESTKSWRLGYNDKTLTWTLIDARTLASRISGTEAMNGEFSLYGYDTDNGFAEEDNRFVSLYGNVGYTYDNRYTVTGSLRWDDSNLFGAKYRSVPLWSVGGAWNINHERFFNVPSVNMLRLRATFGINGNVPRGSSGSFMVVTAGMNQLLGAEYHTIVNPPNDKLTWEKTKTFNAGVDFALLDNRINGTLDYYCRDTDDMLGFVMADPTFGWSSVQRNYGRMRNNGMEVGIGTVNIRNRNFQWRTNMAFSYNKNKLVESYDRAPSVQTYVSGYDIQGYPLNPVFSYRYAGISDQGEPLVYNLEGEKSESVDSTDALVYGGTRRPTYNGGLTNSFSYKGFELSFMFIFSGGDVMRRDKSPYLGQDNFGELANNIHRDVVNRWRAPGDENNPRVTPAIKMQNNIFGSSIWSSRDIDVIKADYVCLRDITLSYDIPETMMHRLGMAGARVFVQGRNIGAWGWDKDNKLPEGGIAGSGAARLKERATWVFGLSFNL